MNVQYRDIDIRDAERSFEEFFTGIGFNIPSCGLKFDGKIHRFQIGDKPNANGAYQFWPSGKSNDGHPNAWVRDWTDGDNEHKWQYRLDGCKVERPTQAEIDARRVAQEQAEARAAEARAKALEIARRHYEGSPSASREHPYLVRKQIADYRGELRQNSDRLLVPFRCITQEGRPIGTIQSISAAPGGRKLFAKGVSPIDGDAAYLIDGDAGSTRVFFAEGMATAESVAAAVASEHGQGFRAVLATGSCGRLKCVAQAARTAWPDAKLYIMADDDFATMMEHNRNPGLDTARDACSAGLADGAFIPPFPRDFDDIYAPENEPTDWNDFMVAHGIDATAQAIERLISESADKKLSQDTDQDIEDFDLAMAGAMEEEQQRPIIIESKMHLRDAVEACVRALRIANSIAPEPVIYVSQSRGASALVQIVEGRGGKAVIREVTANSAGLILSNAADFVKKKLANGGAIINSPVKPSQELIKSFVNADRWDGLPLLNGISQAPVVRPDWSIHDAPGYDPITGVYYDGDEIAYIEQPTQQDALAAAEAICDVIIDFAFEGRDDGDLTYMANTVGFFISCFLRDAGIGLIPMMLIDAPRPGSGKSLLATGASVLMCNRRIPTQPAANDPDEWRKLITTVLLNDMPFVLFDNAKKGAYINDPNLARLITSESYGDRVLGSNTSADIACRAIIVMTGNNPRLGEDMLRRINHIRLNDGNENASDRVSYIHPERHGTNELLTWIETHRHELVGHILTLIRAWAVAGARPWSGKPLDSFEGWSRTVGGILEFVGMTSFQRNRERDAVQMNASNSGSWGAFLLETRQRMNCEPFPVRKIVDECRSDRGYFELIPISQNVHDPNDKKFPAILGRWFSDHNGSTFNVDDGKVKIVHTSTFDRKGGILWSLEWEQAA